MECTTESIHQLKAIDILRQATPVQPGSLGSSIDQQRLATLQQKLSPTLSVWQTSPSASWSVLPGAHMS